jgi:UDP-N-acetylglucosamine--N-acetylmuramyl-(pentapeptide) pyrophosphoryl-undecaprenol N-acetylglucosamine transferase
MKRILAVGGGSGGHVTPVVAVIGELRREHPRLQVQFWCDRRFAPQARKIVADYDPKIPVSTIWSGKFRRYSHLSKLQHLTIPSVIFPNIRDSFLVLVGVGQSLVKLLLWRPDIIFAKGGYVCLPVGLAARILRIPLVIHDSDAVPGLTNRALAPFAVKIATGVPLEHYNYPAAKAKYIGIPIDPVYHLLKDSEKRALKEKLGFDTDRPLLVVTGGGLGSRQINDTVALNLHQLLKVTNVVLLSGAAQYDELRSLTPQADPRFLLKDFIPGLPELFGAADIVVSRAGATALLELAALAMPTILIPSKRLNWQIQHAQLFVEQDAVLSLDEDLFENPGDHSIVDAVKRLLDDDAYRKRLGSNLHKMAKPHAAKEMADIIVDVVKRKRR